MVKNRSPIGSEVVPYHNWDLYRVCNHCVSKPLWLARMGNLFFCQACVNLLSDTFKVPR